MISQLVERMVQEGQFEEVVNNPLAQFGTEDRQYLGATILPEVLQPLNIYREEGIKFRSVIANAGTRYGPVQRKRGVLSSDFLVELGESDIGDELSAKDYDTLLRLIGRAGQGKVSMEAMTRLIGMVDRIANVPLLERNEKDRWDAIVSATVTQRGDNKFVRTISYANPSGHRVTAGGNWSNNAYDPIADIVAGKVKLAEKGYNVNRMVTSTAVVTKLLKNEQIRSRIGSVAVIGGVTAGLHAITSLEKLNSLFTDHGLPAIELYDLQYRTNTSTGYFLSQSAFVMLGTTGRTETLDFGDSEQIPELQHTLGYTGIGTPAGQQSPGRAIFVRSHSDKPPRVEVQAWQTSLPVITEPEAIYVINSIA